MTLNAARRLALLVLLLCAATAHAADDGYRHVLVAGRVSIAIPDHWQSLDKATRQNIAMAAAAKVPGYEVTAADLAVNSMPAPSGAIVRVSLKPGYDMSQAEFVREVRERPLESLAAFRQIGDEMVKGTQSTGVIKLVGEPTSSFKTIGGKLAYVLQYRRKSVTRDDDTYLVTQYYVPLGEKLALITMSRRERDSLLWDAILDKVRQSIAFSGA